MTRPAPALPAATRGMLGLLAAAALFAAVTTVLAGAGGSSLAMHGFILVLQCAVALGAVAALQADAAWLGRVVPVLSVAATLSIWLAAATQGGSALLPGTPMLAVALCVTQMTSSRPAAMFCMALALLGLSGLALVAAVGQLPDAPGPGAGGVVWALSLALVLGAVWLGRLLARQQAQLHRQMSTREARFRALQRMAVDAAWETDHALRIRRLQWRSDGRGDGRRGGRRTITVSEAMGRRPWNLPAMRLANESEDLLRAQTEARESLSGLRVAWVCPDGRERHFVVSGEPRYDVKGRFSGYWGVARDVTGEALAREAHAIAQRRYEHLFHGMPTPLMLLRQGRVLEANGAAAAMLGYDTVESMRGHDLYFEHMDDEHRLPAQERHDDLEGQATEDWLPYEPRVLLRTDGEPVYTLASGSRALHRGRAATLALFVDETRQRSLEGSLRRSEALIGRILELGRDLLWLSDADSGRIVMANDRLLSALDLSRDQVIGRTERQVGLWRDAAERERLVMAAREEDSLNDLPLPLRLGKSGWVPMKVSAARVTSGGQTWLLMCAQRGSPDGRRSPLRGGAGAAASAHRPGFTGTASGPHAGLSTGHEPSHGFETPTEPIPLGERSVALHTGVPPRHGRHDPD